MVLARMWFYSFNGNVILRFWREISFCSFQRKCVFYDFGGKNRFMVLAEKMPFWERNAIYDFGGKWFGLQFWRENVFLRFWQKIVFFYVLVGKCILAGKIHFLENIFLRFWRKNTFLRFWRENKFSRFWRENEFSRVW